METSSKTRAGTVGFQDLMEWPPRCPSVMLLRCRSMGFPSHTRIFPTHTTSIRVGRPMVRAKPGMWPRCRPMTPLSRPFSIDLRRTASIRETPSSIHLLILATYFPVESHIHPSSYDHHSLTPLSNPYTP